MSDQVEATRVPLWVKSRHVQCKTAGPLYSRKRTFEGALILVLLDDVTPHRQSQGTVRSDERCRARAMARFKRISPFAFRVLFTATTNP